jgi:hypothetical protein
VAVGELEAELVLDACELVIGRARPISQQSSCASRCAASIPSRIPLASTFGTVSDGSGELVGLHPG